MIGAILTILLIGAGLTAFGIYQMKTYYGRPHYQNAPITGYAKYENNARGISGLAIDTLSSAAGLKHPVADITSDDGALHSVRLNIAVNDQLIERYPEFDIGGRVDVQFFGDDPKIIYLMNHPMAQTIVKTSGVLLAGIAVLVLAVLMIGADIYYTLTL